MIYIVNQLIDTKYAFTNCVLFSSKCKSIPEFVSLNGFVIKTSLYPESVNIAENIIGVNPIIRQLCKLALNDKIELIEYKANKPKIELNLKLKVSLKKEKISKTHINLDEIYVEKIIKQYLNGHIPTIYMCYYIKLMDDEVYQIKIIETSDIIPVTEFSKIEFVQSESENITISNPNQNLSLFKKSINIQELGIGGLTDEFLVIFRKVFSSRLLPKNVREELGINHVRGMLLYGPPGCGKTALARQLGKLLNCAEPKIVNGPSLLSKYVGESEENTRKLFAEAIEDQKKGRENLHLIICDEFDAIGKKRGLRTSDTGVSDQIVNTFLTMIDGVTSLNNILLVCMTNRRDLIDEALLRSGRLEVQIEIKLPTKEGRKEILTIHTNKMKSSNRFDENIDLEDIATQTQNYSGAELEGLVRNATGYAISREINMDTIKEKKNDKINPIVLKEDFNRALKETKPNLGVINEIYSSIINRINVEYNDNFKNYLEIIESNNIVLKIGSVTSILIYGEPKTYKTYFTCFMAKMFKLNQIQMITPMNFNFTKADIIEAVDKCKVTTNSCLIFDDLEGIFSWNNIHSTYDNTIYQMIRNSCKTFLKEDQQLLVIANCNNCDMIQLMNLKQVFDYNIYL